jgi:hypothetical protein
MPEPRLVLRDYRPFAKNTLRGFATFEFPSGLVIHDITVHVKGERAWVAFPGVPQLDNGTVKQIEGKPQYKRIIEWRDRDLTDGFSAAAVAVIRREKPGALD